MTLIEVAIVLSIIAIMAVIFVATLSGTRTGDYIDRGAQQIYDDLILIRSRALSTNANHRLNFASVTSWRIQSFNGTGWDDVGDVRNMPSDTYLASLPGTNPEATPRGLFTASGSPYVTVTGLGATKTKSIYISVGGAIDIKIP